MVFHLGKNKDQEIWKLQHALALSNCSEEKFVVFWFFDEEPKETGESLAYCWSWVGLEKKNP